MKQIDQRKAAKQFSDAWRNRGYEKGDAQVFWTELLHDVVGVKRVSDVAKFEYRTSGGGFIDCYLPDTGILIEQKGLGIDLDKPEERQGRMVTPFEQALSYAESFPRSHQPRFILVCNFDTFRVYDRDAYSKDDLPNHPFEFTLEELGKDPNLITFINDPSHSRAERERKVSMEAGRLIGKIYTALREQYIDPDSEESAHALNVLCVRLVFCLFCEDANLFPKDAFLNYLKNVEPVDMRMALKRLFKALDTPIDERDPYDEAIKTFPYVNGGLFADEEEIPNFNQELKHLLLFEAAQQTDWSQISPTIFGGIFESTLNPETRRSGGMHYTSPENIHRVIDPLFLDELKDEFESIVESEGLTPRQKLNRLRKLHSKMVSLKFLDPACGSGNFLTETYLSLRALEDDVLNILNNGQVEIAFDFGASDNEEDSTAYVTDRIRLSQFYGIEVNDFAVRVAKTALWIAQLQANNESEMILDLEIGDFPLTDNPHIVEGNALRIDWQNVISANECSYIIGNPPFVGHQWRSSQQQEDMAIVFEGFHGYGKLDYVCAWYILAARYIGTRNIHAAFVSTNSICQGESVRLLWEPMAKLGIEIDFAYPTFVWGNEASAQAHVHVVIVGFSSIEHPLTKKRIFYVDSIVEAKHINGYLFNADDVFIANRGKPINADAPKITKGSQPTDGGNLILSEEEAEALITKYPQTKNIIHPFMGAREFLNGKTRYCLWFEGACIADYNFPEIRERLKAVALAREKSPTKSVREAASTPAKFTQNRQPKSTFLALPKTTSGRRKYIPIGFMTPDIIVSDKLHLIPDADLFLFALLESQMHQAWMRIVSGRLKSDYEYSPSVYNSFVFPNVSVEQREHIEELAQAVLNARALYSEVSLADLYDPDNEFIYSELNTAHKALDRAIEEAYGVNFDGDESKIVAHLFKLYIDATEA